MTRLLIPVRHDPAGNIDIPSFTIRDIDEALILSLRKWMTGIVTTNSPIGASNSVPIRMATSERSWLEKRLSIRDDAEAAIIPVIEIFREDRNIHNTEMAMPGDRRFLIISQRNNKSKSANNQRHQGAQQFEDIDEKQYYISDSYSLNQTTDVVEYSLSMHPRFTERTYSIRCWASSVNDLNAMENALICCPDSWKNLYPLLGSKGQTYTGQLDETVSNGESNSRDMTGSTRLLYSEWTMRVQGFLLNKDQNSLTRVNQTVPGKISSYSRIQWGTETD